MNYRLDKRRNSKRIIWFSVFVVILLLINFRAPIFNALANFSNFVLKPIFSTSSGLTNESGGFGAFLSSQKDLLARVSSLESELELNKIQIENYKALEAENLDLKEILGRANSEDSLVLADILLKPNRSLYDTLVIDAGENEGIKNGDLVLALGFVPIGKVAEVYPNSAKVVLFSSPGERNEVLIDGQNIFIEAIGRGGDNFEITLPREIELAKDTAVFLPGAGSRILGEVEVTISDPRDSFTKVLLVSPVNTQKLRFVQVKIN